MSTAQENDRSTVPGVSRRDLLAAGAIGIPCLALVACSRAGSGAPTSPATAGGGALAKLSDIKVGEAVSAKGADGKPIVIARPTETTVAAFSAICTHQGSIVAPVGKEFRCPTHGSVFDATTGNVIHGPAQRPLSQVKVTLSGDDVVAG
ncbi:ubiquinol-cytochrome c reductase iron-sulfur subunit [Jatrophihabitans sp.]|uniref:QcrA and Rieske domain-containing protein n=1 Tax=Jatrophihabitans sp. TaxID=1932789 RepID=UPI002EE48191